MSLTEASLLEDVRRRLFAPSRSANPRAIGIELELIPLLTSTRRPATAVTSDGTVSTADVLARLGAVDGWTEQKADGDPSAWLVPDGSRISFEPGGQIEISSPPQASASTLISQTRILVTRLRAKMAEDGIELVARGVDPYNDIAATPLQLHRERYTRMTRYFDGIGPSGVRMMRQTAALQINLEHGDDPPARWRLLNALAPIVLALFANSRDYAGKPTGWSSYRSQLWRTLDPSRTGIPYAEEDPAARYLAFALDAGAMRASDTLPRSFREWMRDPSVNIDDWSFHLSTLFPEVRPKEFFELRSADTIEPEFLAAPVVFVTSLVYDAGSARKAVELLGAPSANLLERAGRDGLRDDSIRSMASRLVDCALEGAARLGGDYIAASDLEVASQYFAHALKDDDIRAVKPETAASRNS
ncbi:MAG TPA: glutamate-cysteine ligase family protein [Gemmatimonadaceae bacterium]|nr:glutamate-cysteine ligase family protein [Gemmatimonadaceae bacterium]